MNTAKLANRLAQAGLIYGWKRNQRCQPTGKILPGLIVSLTSFPARINTTWIAIESILRQSTRPEKITLILSSPEFESRSNLPKEFEIQKEHGLEIIWTDQGLRSYGKLIPVKESYPDASIVTIDDDVIYHKDMLKNLIKIHKACPQQIIGSRGYEILKNSDERPLPYTHWIPADISTPSSSCFLTGVGGVLYPPNSLPWRLAFNRQLFMSLCPTADDIWFWAMSLIHGRQRKCLGTHDIQEIKRLIKTPRLSRNNVRRGGNDRQIEAIINHFDLDKLTKSQEPT